MSASRVGCTGSPGALPAGTARHAYSTHCSTSSRSSVLASGLVSPVSSPSSRSSTWPTCTMPKINCAARGRRSPSSPLVDSPIPWSFACPARPDDAAAMLRTCVAAAMADSAVSVFLEPIALYHRRDLHNDGDGGWLAVDHGLPAPIGTARLYRSPGSEVTMITFGNGVPMSLRVARRLAAQGIAADVLDLRWLAPLPIEAMLAAARATGRVVGVDETRHTGGVGEGVLSALVEHGFDGAIVRVASQDSFVPLGPAASLVLLSEDEIEKAAITVAQRERGAQ